VPLVAVTAFAAGEVLQPLFLVLAGVGAGLTGSVAGLASLVSYPALLALGLPPVVANVTNTVALVGSTAGSVGGSRTELVGRARTLVPLAAVGVLGGSAGAVLLLRTPSAAFEVAVPFLVAVGSTAMLLRGRVVERSAAGLDPRVRRFTLFGVAAIGVYSGYFGAGAGVLLLALLLHTSGEALPVANAAKNVVLGAANGTAAVGFALFGPVRWSAALPLALGSVLGGLAGPAVVRRVSAARLRVVIGLAGLGLAVKLAFDAFG